MRFEIWSLYLLTSSLSSLTPGPAVLTVVSGALRAGAARGNWAIFGILAANVVYFAIAAFGLLTLLAQSGQVFLAIKWIGAAYLVWMGLRSLLGRAGSFSVTETGAAHSVPRGELFRGAFVMQMTNPKVYLYILAILPQFVDPAAPVLPQIAIIAPTSLVAEFLILNVYAVVAGRTRRLTLGSDFVGFANRAAGIMLIAAGLLVATFGTH